MAVLALRIEHVVFIVFGVVFVFFVGCACLNRRREKTYPNTAII